MISLTLRPAAEKLRNDLRSWLSSNPPPVLASDADISEFVDVSRKWQATLARERWLAVHWPEQYGGRGLSVVEEAIIQEELAKHQSPQLVNLFGLTMVGPVLIRYGTAEQKSRYLKKILYAEEIWCQGFSEPTAGSDLANLKARATRLDDGTWRISGQKVWTSFAQYSDWCFLLARSEPGGAKHEGLSYFLVPMKQQSVSVRPLRQITGDEEFNEVFFDDTAVPAECLVGQPGQGWTIAISTLMFERVVLTFSRQLQSHQAMVWMCREFAEALTSDLAAEFGRLVATDMAVRALALSHLVTYSEAQPPGPEGSLDKLGWSEHFQHVARMGFDLATAQLQASSDTKRMAAHRYLYSRGRTIAAGTSEIQRNIIAERILGLPRR